MGKVEYLNMPYISYCEIPDYITDGHWIGEGQPDCYVPYTVQMIRKSELDKWIIEEYPELKGRTILIQLDF